MFIKGYEEAVGRLKKGKQINDMKKDMIQK